MFGIKREKSVLGKLGGVLNAGGEKEKLAGTTKPKSKSIDPEHETKILH